MKELGLYTKYRKTWKKTTIADPNAYKRMDLIHRNFSPPTPTTHLCGDITYVRTKQGWMYLATVIDITTRMIVGWAANDCMTTDLIINALDMAHTAGYVAHNAVFHSDRGSQYTSQKFTEYARKINVRLSVGDAGVCWDNAVAESFFSTYKLHMFYHRKSFDTKLHATVETGQWISSLLQPPKNPLHHHNDPSTSNETIPPPTNTSPPPHLTPTQNKSSTNNKN